MPVFFDIFSSAALFLNEGDDNRIHLWFLKKKEGMIF